jgi:hypothetical protein
VFPGHPGFRRPRPARCASDGGWRYAGRYSLFGQEREAAMTVDLDAAGGLIGVEG